MGHIRLIFAALFMALLVPAGAQVEGMRSFSNPRVLNSSVGLSSDVINDAVMDADGALWIATPEGLDRFDGTQVQHFRHDAADSSSLPYNEVHRLALGADGALWVGTAQGLARYDPHTRRFKRYLNRPSDSRSLPNNYVTNVLVDRAGRVWVGTYTSGFARYRPESDDFDRIIQPDAPNSYLQRQQRIAVMIVQDQQEDERLWICTAGGLLELDVRSMQVRVVTVPPSGDDARLNDDRNTLRRILSCPNGDLLISTSGAGVHRFVPRTGSFTTYAIPSKSSRALNHMSDLVIDRDGTIYVSSTGGGLAVLDTLKGTLELLVPADRPDLRGIAGVGINGIALQADGTMLVFTDRDLRLFSPQRERFHALTIPDGEGSSINKKRLGPVLAVNTHEVLVGGIGTEGLYRADLNSGKVKLLIPPPMPGLEPRESFHTRAMLRDGDQVLALSEEGLYRVDLRNDRIEPVITELYERVEPRLFLSMARHPSGDLYIGTRHDGLFRLSAELRVLDQFTHDPNDTNSIIGSDLVGTVQVDPEGRVWATTERGMSVFDPRTRRFRTLRSGAGSEASDPIIHVSEVVFDVQGGAFLAHPRTGASHIADRQAEPWVVEPVALPAMLASNWVLDVYIGTDGAQWIAGPDAFVRRKESDHSYGTAQGLPSYQLGNMTELPDGRLVGTSGMRLSWQARTPATVPPRTLHVELQQLHILGMENSSSAKLLEQDVITLSYDQRFFTLGIGALDVLGIQPHRLEYQLHPFNENWSPGGPEALAVFTNVPPGDYRFRARAVSADGIVLGQLEVPLTVLPPFWGTWWFRLVVVFMVLSILYALYRYRIGTIRKEAMLTAEFNTRLSEMELTALRAQMNPHFLFNSLNSIRHHVLNSDTEAADRYLSKFARLIRLILDHSDQSLVPLSEELQALRLYLELEAARFDDKFDFRITVDPAIGLDTTMVPPMLIQPFLENAVWHGLMQKDEGGSIDLSITQRDRDLTVVVEDDGIGRARAGELKSRSGGRSRSRGMSITQQRLEMLAHQRGTDHHVRVEDLVLADGTAGGTRITLTIPLN